MRGESSDSNRPLPANSIIAQEIQAHEPHDLKTAQGRRKRILDELGDEPVRTCTDPSSGVE